MGSGRGGGREVGGVEVGRWEGGNGDVPLYRCGILALCTAPSMSTACVSHQGQLVLVRVPQQEGDDGLVVDL